MNNFASNNPTGDNSEEENLRKFLADIFNGQLPPGALESMDLSELAKQTGLPADPSMLKMAALQMQSLFSNTDGPINWKIGHELAKQVAAGKVTSVPSFALPKMGGTAIGCAGDPLIKEEVKAKFKSSGSVAAMWLAAETDFAVVSQPVDTWSRGTWVNRTLPRWQKIVEPVAGYMVEAIGDALAKQLGAPEPTKEQLESSMNLPFSSAREVMQKIGGSMFGMQFGFAIGSFARESLGVTDLSLPLWDEYAPVMVPANVEDFMAGTDLDEEAVYIFLTAREIAHQTLFKNAPWLSEHLLTAIESYARGITLDLEALEEKIRAMNLDSPPELTVIDPHELFTFTRDSMQERALEELTTTLALIEGWVDLVVTRALGTKLPKVEAMREMIRRRRANSNQAEDLLVDLVGIELRGRKVKDAYSWWESVLETEGIAKRDQIWGHPDLLPSYEVLAGTPKAPINSEAANAEQLADFSAMNVDSEAFDEELRKLLEGDLDS